MRRHRARVWLLQTRSGQVGSLERGKWQSGKARISIDHLQGLSEGALGAGLTNRALDLLYPFTSKYQIR
jgi:hypothetical protein